MFSSSSGITFAGSREALGLPPPSSCEVGKPRVESPPTARELSLGAPGELVKDRPAPTPPAGRVLYYPDYIPARIVREATTQVALEGFKTIAALSLSTYFAIHITHYRNCVGVENPDWVEKIGRRVIGELCYAALIVVSLVEAAVRIVLLILSLIIVMPLVLCCLHPKVIDKVGETFVHYFLFGGWLSSSNAFSCAIGFLKNLPVKTLRYENLFPPSSGVWNFAHDVFRSREERRAVDAVADERSDWKMPDYVNANLGGLR